MAGFSFGNTKTSAQTYVSPFKDMPGAYGWAAEKGLAYSFGKPFSQEKFRFGELGPGGRDQARPRRHACGARLPGRRGLPPALGRLHQRAVAYCVPGHGSPDLLAHCRRRDRPHRVGVLHLGHERHREEGRYYAFNENRGVAGDIGFDPLGFSAKGDLRGEELIVGRIAMLGIAGMVAQELNTAGYLFYPDTY